MKKVFCLDDGKEYFFVAINGYDAIQKMLYTLNITHRDNNVKIELCNGRTWSLEHNGKTYACLLTEDEAINEVNHILENNKNIIVWYD